MKDISVIITTYNAQDTIKNAIWSVLDTIYKSKIEIIVVDDCSNDETTNIVEDIIKQHDNIKFIKLEENTGNPSKPRNIGIENAKGHYITFLDDDDEMNSDNLLNMVNHAKIHDLDCIKGYVKVVRGNEILNMGKLNCDNNDSLDVIKKIIAGQSTRIDIIIKRDFLIDNQIRFEDYKIGEDTIFYADLFVSRPKIEYYNSFIHYHHKRANITNLSSTQNYQDNELYNHLKVWNVVEQKLKKIGISYFELRLPIAIKNTITSIVYYSKGKISKKCFLEFSKFLNENKFYLDSFNFHERYKEIYQSILENDHEKFLEVSKKRLLIAGYDLKFITPILKYLEDDYNIKIDEWIGHNDHDEAKSTKLLNWTDFIFCEWLLGNAVWYSKRKMNHQKLIIRAHRFEATRNFGNQINFAKVDGVIVVSYPCLELFSNIFEIPREKMILLSNYVETDIYTGIKKGDFKHNLAMVGYVPKLKGLLKGLKILKMLKENDDKFKLYLMGKDYKELDWVWNNPEERSYFRECENFIKDNKLEDSVIFEGWVERSEMFSNIGYVLSVSDIESFHLAPAEGLCDLTLALLLYWNGSEYIYPRKMIFDNIDDIVKIILDTYSNNKYYHDLLEEMGYYIIKEFNIEKIVIDLKNIFDKMSLI